MKAAPPFKRKKSMAMESRVDLNQLVSDGMLPVESISAYDGPKFDEHLERQ